MLKIEHEPRAMDCSSFMVEATIRSYLVDKDICTSSFNEESPYQRQTGNINLFGLGVLKDGVIVGLVLEKISSICSLISQRRRPNICHVSDLRFSED